MPPKARVSLASMVAEDTTQPAPEPIATAPQASVTDLEARPAGVGKNTKRVGLYLHPAVKREMDTIAFTHERKPHDLYLEAIDLLLRKYGRSSIGELEKK
jgi:hypothetical protein